jgi:hypothetical protein
MFISFVLSVVVAYLFISCLVPDFNARNTADVDVPPVLSKIRYIPRLAPDATPQNNSVFVPIMPAISVP